MRKPKVITRCVANNYTAADERIIEFSDNGKGGLISFRRRSDGKLVVSIYNVDPDIIITVPQRLVQSVFA